MNNKYKNLIILTIILLSYILIINLLGYDYGSMIDWISQHFRIPEYFRNFFYQTNNLLPDFTLNLGSGQNIYYLAYHGLFNPIILLSYIFPFIKMMDYIIISYIILILISTYLIYYWLNNKYSNKIAFIGSLTFLLASPLIYHSHRHLMFINYMPFLILALIGVDHYFKDNKKILLIISCSLIIFSSFYFSIPSIIIITLYAINTYLNTNKKSNKLFIKTSIKFLFLMIIPILISSILIIPTVYTLINGRNPTNTNINILSTFIPKFNSNALLYYTYGLGLTSFSIISIINNIFNKNHKYRFLSISILTILFIPFFLYLLNGFMYIDGKVLIPFLPILCLLISNTFNNIFNNNVNIKKLIILSTLLTIIIILNNFKFSFNLIFIIDYIIIILSLIIYYKWKLKPIILIPYIIIILINFISFNIPNSINASSDQLVEKDDIKEYENKLEKELFEIINNDNNVYRTNNLNNILYNVNNIINDNYYVTSIYSSSTNHYYTNFIRNIFKNEIYNKDYATITESNNLLFNLYMGNKYLISDYSLLGYKLIKEGHYTNLYQNNNTNSIGYATNNILSLNEFNKLEYPYTMDALLHYAVIDNNLSNEYKNNITKIDTNYDKFIFDIKDELEYDITLKEKLHNEILIISFDMLYNETCNVSNQSITINNVINTLSCKTWKYHNKNNRFNYVISSDEDINKLHIKINKGHYEIDNISLYKIKYNDIINNNFDQFIINKSKTLDNKIIGNIDVTNDNSYFILNIPYDKGFNIEIDNIKTDYELVNTSFIGFSINKGIHEITITYHAPYKILGLVLSIIGLIILIIIIIIEKRGRKWKRLKNL